MQVQNEGETMSEIPMPASEPYQPPRQSSGYGTCCKIAVVICVLLIIGMLIIALAFMGGLINLFGGIIGNGSNFESRTLVSYNNIDVDIYEPLGTYYYDDFDVYSYEVLTTTSPDVLFDISVDDTGVDAVSVTIHIAIYDIDRATFDSITTWSGLDTYLVDEGDYTNQVDTYFNLNNNADTYVWVFWFDAASKTDTWTVDIDITLRYNWNL